MFQMKSDDELFNDDDKNRSIRDYLSKLSKEEEVDMKVKSPIYKEGFREGFEAGQREAYRIADNTIWGLVKIHNGADNF